MIWFMERDDDFLICEIRRSPESEAFEFELAPSSGGQPETRSFSSASELIDQYLIQQSALLAQGWRPKLSASAEY